MEHNPESELVINVDPDTPGAIVEEDLILEPTRQQVPQTPRQQVAEAPIDPPDAEDGIAHLRRVALETTPTGLPTTDAEDEARHRAIQVATRSRPKGARTRLTNVGATSSTPQGRLLPSLTTWTRLRRRTPPRQVPWPPICSR